MDFQTGTITSLTELKGAILSFLVANGWTQEGTDIIYKGSVYAELTTGYDFTPAVSHLMLRGGTGTTGGGALTGVQDAPKGLTWLHNGAKIVTQFGAGTPFNPVDIAWPASYTFVLNDSPTEEFWCFIQFNGSWCQYMGFGNLIKTCNYSGGEFYNATFNAADHVSGYSPHGYQQLLFDQPVKCQNREYAGVVPFAGVTSSSGNNFNYNTGCSIHAEIDQASWVSGTYVQGYYRDGTVKVMMEHMAHFEEYDVSDNGPDPKVQTIPIRVYGRFKSGNLQKLGEVGSLRYCRIAGLSFGEIFTDGTDTWKYFPIVFKEDASPDPAYGEPDSGTFGMAVKFNG